MTKKVIRCYCGWVGEGDDSALVTAAQLHGREAHRTEYTREEVLAMAELTE